MLYPLEKFYDAVELLASGTSSIHDRLLDACISGLFLPEEKEIPESLRQDFINLKKELTSEDPVGDEGSIKATISKMTPERASALAKKIVYLHSKLENLEAG